MATIPRVNRGDLITAEFINLLLDAVNGLDTRVAALESTGSTTNQNQVVITSLEPPTGGVRVGQDLTIRGRNFGHSAGRLRVFIDNVAITNFNRPGTNDENIIITIPPEFGTPSPPLEGRAALLTVSNSITPAQRTILLLPVAELIGTVPVTLRRTEPVTPAANAQFTVFLTMESRLSRPALVQIVANVSGIATTPQVLSDALTPLDPQVQVADRQVLQFAVRMLIPPVTAQPVGTPPVQFTVTVSANVEGTQRGVLSIPFTVGTAAEQPDPTITVPMPTAADSITPVGQGSFASGTLRLQAGATAEITFPVTLAQAGSYTATATLEGGATGWTSTIFDNSSFAVVDGDLQNPQGRTLRMVRLRVNRPNGVTAGAVRVRVRPGTGNGTSQVITLALN